MRLLPLIVATGAAAVLAPAPATAQAANERTVIVFGTDPCPTNTSGDDIVICIRRDENERYRIPQELRTPIDSPENESWATRAQALEYVGRTGTMSCSPVGPGGFTGCYAQMVRDARAERNRSALNPEPLP